MGGRGIDQDVTRSGNKWANMATNEQYLHFGLRILDFGLRSGLWLFGGDAAGVLQTRIA
jgi:hypothetical protein